jgi:hypothetical protein
MISKVSAEIIRRYTATFFRRGFVFGLGNGFCSFLKNVRYNFYK